MCNQSSCVFFLFTCSQLIDTHKFHFGGIYMLFIHELKAIALEHEYLYFTSHRHQSSVYRPDVRRLPQQSKIMAYWPHRINDYCWTPPEPPSHSKSKNCRLRFMANNFEWSRSVLRPTQSTLPFSGDWVVCKLHRLNHRPQDKMMIRWADEFRRYGLLCSYSSSQSSANANAKLKSVMLFAMLHEY